MDMDDLTEDLFVVVCMRKSPDVEDSSDIVYIWQGEEFEEPNTSSNKHLSVQEFIDKVK